MSEAKMRIFEAGDQPQSNVSAPETRFTGVVNNEVDAGGVKFEIPAIPEHYFQSGDVLTCIMCGGQIEEGVIVRYSNLAVSKRNPEEAMFQMRKGASAKIGTLPGAFEECVTGMGDPSYKGELGVFYSFVSNKKEIFSGFKELNVDFSESGNR